MTTTTKQTILYSRLSREDERANESLSIENQKAFLEEYAIRNGFTNLVHLSDDGWSGTRWDRPGMTKLLDEVDKGMVSAVLCKDADVNPATTLFLRNFQYLHFIHI